MDRLSFPAAQAGRLVTLKESGMRKMPLRSVMRVFLLLASLSAVPGDGVWGADSAPAFPLKVSGNRRYLVDQQDNPLGTGEGDWMQLADHAGWAILPRPSR